MKISKNGTKKIIASVLIAAATLTFASCGKQSDMTKASKERPMMAKGFATSVNSTLADSAMFVAEEAAFESENAGNAAEPDIAEVERKLIKTANMSLKVDNLDNAENQIQNWCSAYGGYIFSSNGWEQSRNYTIKVPVDKFDAALNSLNGVGSLISKSVSAEDVSDQYYDLESRLNTKTILLHRLEAYLKDAKNVEELISIERQINSVQSEVESMQGRMKRLRSQVDYSTIYIDIRSPSVSNFEGWSPFKIKMHELGESLGSFFSGLLVIVIGIIAFGIPLFLVGCLFYWLCFGKVGLIRKFVKKLK
ncbi:MAG: DUF4349 domain-containing protein [Treponema sp.]|nr:DUF4349 domain-containing protein [Treponema sp.]